MSSLALIIEIYIVNQLYINICMTLEVVKIKNPTFILTRQTWLDAPIKKIYTHNTLKLVY